MVKIPQVNPPGQAVLGGHSKPVRERIRLSTKPANSIDAMTEAGLTKTARAARRKRAIAKKRGEAFAQKLITNADDVLQSPDKYFNEENLGKRRARNFKQRKSEYESDVNTDKGNLNDMLHVAHAFALHMALGAMHHSMMQTGLQSKLRLIDSSGNYTTPLVGAKPTKPLPKSLYNTAKAVFSKRVKSYKNVYVGAKPGNPWTLTKAKRSQELSHHVMLKPLNWSMSAGASSTSVDTLIQINDRLMVDDLNRTRVFTNAPDRSVIAYSDGVFGSSAWRTSGTVLGQVVPNLLPYMLGIQRENISLLGGVIKWDASSAHSYMWVVAEGGDLSSVPDKFKPDPKSPMRGVSRWKGTEERIYYRAHIPVDPYVSKWLQAFRQAYESAMNYYTKQAVFMLNVQATDAARHGFKMTRQQLLEFMANLKSELPAMTQVDGQTLKGYIK